MGRRFCLRPLSAEAVGRPKMKYPLVLMLLLSLPLAPVVWGQSADEQLAASSALFDAHKYKEAAQALASFLAAHPTHAKAGAAALALGRCRSELGEYAQAVPAYQKAVASKDPAVITFAELGLGEAALRTSQWRVAAGALEAATAKTLTPEQGAIAWDWLGQAQFQLGQFAPADRAYRTVLAKYPQSDYAADATFGAGLAEMRLGQGDDARVKLKTLVDQYPNSPDRAQAQAQLGQMDLDAKHWSEARAEFDAALAGKGLDADARKAAREGLVSATLGAGDFAGAASHLQTILDKMTPDDPQRPQAELTLGNALYRQKEYEPALAAYQAAARSPDAAVASEGAYWAANAQLALKHAAEAAALFAEVAAKYPRQPLAARAQLRAGDALMAAGQGAAASRAYRVVLAKYPQSPEAKAARKALGGALDATDDPAQLAAALANATGPEKVTGTLRLVRLYLAAKKYAPAQASVAGLLSGAALTAKQSAEAHYLLGLALDAQNKNAPAAAALAQASLGDPQAAWFPDAQTQLAWLYVGLKEPARAEASATAALARRGTDGLTAALEQQARLALVQADLDQKKWDGALTQCQDLLASNPPADVQATVLYTQAWVSDKQNKHEAALPLWEKLAETYPGSDYAPEARLRLADAPFGAGHYDEARDKYTALLTRYPRSAVAPEARFKLGSSLYNLGKYDEAAAQFDQVAADKAAGDYQSEGLYWAGASFQKAGKSAQAIARLSRLVADFPASPRVANAKVRLAALKAVNGG